MPFYEFDLHIVLKHTLIIEENPSKVWQNTLRKGRGQIRKSASGNSFYLYLDKKNSEKL